MGDPPWRIADKRISVQGTRGKTSLSISLHSEVVYREKTSFCKVTGTLPLLCIGKDVKILRRRGSTRLYENLLNVPHSDYCVLENQGVSPYTMRVFNDLFVKPQIVAVTNVRLDHVEEMGRTREKIARSIASSFGEAEIVFSGEMNDHLNDIMSRKAKKLVRVRPAHPHLPGAEIPALLNEILEFLGLGSANIDAYLEAIRKKLRWREINGIVYFNASKVNDPDSATLLVRWLGERPFIFIQLRRDRPGRTWAFLKMMRERWVDYSKVAVAGEWSYEFSKRVGGMYLPDSCEGTDLLLDEVRRSGSPLFITGNRRGSLVRCLLPRLGVKDEVPTLMGKSGDGVLSLP
ncbi:MAG: Mur ligase family protein [Candidatus Korarchaeota archaeon]|nr:Mur ligase family protein [Candidatus Korarchaeota archaeon]